MDFQDISDATRRALGQRVNGLTGADIVRRMLGDAPQGQAAQNAQNAQDANQRAEDPAAYDVLGRVQITPDKKYFDPNTGFTIDQDSMDDYIKQVKSGRVPVHPTPFKTPDEARQWQAAQINKKAAPAQPQADTSGLQPEGDHLVDPSTGYRVVNSPAAIQQYRNAKSVGALGTPDEDTAGPVDVTVGKPTQVRRVPAAPAAPAPAAPPGRGGPAVLQMLAKMAEGAAPAASSGVAPAPPISTSKTVKDPAPDVVEDSIARGQAVAAAKTPAASAVSAPTAGAPEASTTPITVSAPQVKIPDAPPPPAPVALTGTLAKTPQTDPQLAAVQANANNQAGLVTAGQLMQNGFAQAVGNKPLSAPFDAARQQALNPIQQLLQQRQAVRQQYADQQQRSLDDPDSDLSRIATTLAVGQKVIDPGQKITARMWQMAQGIADTNQRRLALQAEIARANAEMSQRAQLEAAKLNTQVSEGAKDRAVKLEASGADYQPDPVEVSMLAKQTAGTGHYQPPRGMYGMRGDRLAQAVFRKISQDNPGIDLAKIQAEYEANKANLTGLTKQTANLDISEDTVNGAIQILQDAVKQAPNVGAPFLNTPIRSLDEKVFGSGTVSRFKAAQTILATEAGKVLQNNALTGDLTDDARKEMRSVIDGGATPQQVQDVAGILRQLMMNRTGAMHKGLEKAQAAVASPSASSAPGAPGKAAVGPHGMAVMQNGHIYRWNVEKQQYE